MQITSSGKGVTSMPIIPINEQLVVMLEQLYKPLVVTPETSINEVMFNAGQQAVIRLLRMHYDRHSQ
jgi:hypothetical protein